MNRKYSISCLSGQEHHMLLMRTIFDIVKRKSTVDWDYQEQGRSDVVIFDFDAPPPEHPALRHGTPPHLLISYSRDRPASTPTDFHLSKPVRTRDLLDLLAGVENLLHREKDRFFERAVNPFERAGTLRPAPRTVYAPESVTRPDPAQAATQLIDDVVGIVTGAGVHPVGVALGNEIFYIDSRQKKVWSPLPPSRLAGLVSHCPPVTRISVGPHPPMDAFPMTLTDFLYELTLLGKPVALVKALPADCEFLLTQWPQMTASPNARQMIRLAAYFSKYRSNLARAAEELSLGPEPLAGFINAAYGQGLLAWNPPAACPPTPGAQAFNDTQSSGPSGGLGGLFSRIRRKFGI